MGLFKCMGYKFSMDVCFVSYVLFCFCWGAVMVLGME